MKERLARWGRRLATFLEMGVLVGLLALWWSADGVSTGTAIEVLPGVQAPGVDLTAELTRPPIVEVTAVRPDDPQRVGSGDVDLRAELITTGLEFPVWLTAPAGSDLIYVLEQPGRIRVIEDGEVVSEPYLDITPAVEDEGLEQGLTGLAFHPDHANNNRVFVSYTSTNATRIVEYQARDPYHLDVSTGRLVLSLQQPHEYHNGGNLVFGPDGNLWIGSGDGGGIGDPWDNGQNPHTLLGTVLRINVDFATPYAIPSDNPYADGIDGAPEVWAWGLRNPWRLTFSEDGRILIADVGHEKWEEVDIAPITGGGANYGWPVMEGDECFQADECDSAGLTMPDLTLVHDGLCAIIGGPVYRGAAIPEAYGHYFYGDYCVGWLELAPLTEDGLGEGRRVPIGRVGQITSIAEDGHGEVIFAAASGDIYRVIRSDSA